MINILVPLAGKDTYGTSKSNPFPLILTELDGGILLQQSAKPFLQLNREKKIVAAIPKPEIDKYKLDKVFNLLGDCVSVCSINEHTQGSVCSALLAIENLDLSAPLIITSFEQVLDFDITEIVSDMLESDVDGGVITFESIHPKWSFVKINSDNFVTEAAEKRPISNKAIAGLYYFKTGDLFVRSAMAMIRKDVKIDNRFYISECLNEVILNNGKVKAYDIDGEKYFHINNKHALESYEARTLEYKQKIRSRLIAETEKYIKLFNKRDIVNIRELMDEKFTLSDPDINALEREEALLHIENLFLTSRDIKFLAKNISVTDDFSTFIEFELNIDGKKMVGIDCIHWSKSFRISSMNAYLYEKKQ